MRKNNRKSSQKKSNKNNPNSKKVNTINTSNLSVMWTEKMGMVGTFQVYEKPDLREVASMLLDAAPSERGYVTAHKTKSGYTFVMEGGYSVKIAKFADFAKLHRAEAEDFKRNAAKGLKQVEKSRARDPLQRAAADPSRHKKEIHKSRYKTDPCQSYSDRGFFS